MLPSLARLHSLAQLRSHQQLHLLLLASPLTTPFTTPPLPARLTPQARVMPLGMPTPVPGLEMCACVHAGNGTTQTTADLAEPRNARLFTGTVAVPMTRESSPDHTVLSSHANARSCMT